MSELDLDLEKARKEKEDLAKELEKVENEAQAIQTRRKVQFINSNSKLDSWPNLSTPIVISILSRGQLISNQGISQSTPSSSSTISTQVPFVQPQHSQSIVLNEANVSST